MTYQEKLKDPRWQKKRLEILERDDWKCVLCCNSKDTLHVHHKFYNKSKNPWDYENEMLETLCEDCHKDDHVHSFLISSVLTREIRKKFSLNDMIIITGGLVLADSIEGDNYNSLIIHWLLTDLELQQELKGRFSDLQKDKNNNAK